MTQTAYLQHLNDVLTARRKRNEAIKKAITIGVATISILALPVGITIRDNARLAEWESTREVHLIRVESGDSVDEYWAKYAPSWMDRSDYRTEFKELNDLDSCFLYENQWVKIYTTAD